VGDPVLPQPIRRNAARLPTKATSSLQFDRKKKKRKNFACAKSTAAQWFSTILQQNINQLRNF
jgi:hypothetical protein